MNPEEVKVTINPDGKTCTVIANEIPQNAGKIPGASAFFGATFKGQQAEAERKTYEISGCSKFCQCLKSWPQTPLCECHGSVHTARIVDGKAVIV